MLLTIFLTLWDPVLLGVDGLDELDGLGPGRGAEVEHLVVGLHVQHARGDHRHRLLSADVAWDMTKQKVN